MHLNTLLYLAIQVYYLYTKYISEILIHCELQQNLLHAVTTPYYSTKRPAQTMTHYLCI